MKIGLIGFGYWGKIIFNNFLKLGYDDIVICDKIDIINQNLLKKISYESDYRKIECDKVFIVVPTKEHYEIVKYFLNKGVDVFCEKPLTLNYETSKELYALAKQNSCDLFVDWIFTFNPQIMRLKKLMEFNDLNCKNIIFNRLNFGPERYDVNAVLDLASHDISILSYLFEEDPININWLNFKRNRTSIQNDSTVGIIEYKNFTAQINASWYYGEKYRKSFFEFDKGFIYWDDKDQILDINFNIKNDYSININNTPLEMSILSFIKNNVKFNQTELTLRIQKIIEKGNDSKF